MPHAHICCKLLTVSHEKEKYYYFPAIHHFDVVVISQLFAFSAVVLF